MELIGCTCPVGFGLAHDHIVGPDSAHELSHYDPDTVGRLWVDWRKVARELMRADDGVLTSS